MEARSGDTISRLATGQISNLRVAWSASDLLHELPDAAGRGRFPDLCQDARELLRCETSFALARRWGEMETYSSGRNGSLDETNRTTSGRVSSVPANADSHPHTKVHAHLADVSSTSDVHQLWEHVPSHSVEILLEATLWNTYKHYKGGRKVETT